MAGSSARIDSAFHSYGEVLDATKHQDDKIGRFLTAIAFLFTGAVAFGTRPEILSITVQVRPSETRALPAIFLACFLVLALLSVLLLVVALGPNLKLPRGSERHNRRPSPYFFLSIAGFSRGEWNNEWVAPRPTSARLEDALIEETHNLATKTDFKFNRTNEARALFTLGLLFLAVFAVLSFSAIARIAPPSETLGWASAPRVVVQWDAATRYAVAAVIATFAFVLAYDYLRLDQELDNRAPDRFSVRLLPMYFLMVSAPVLVLALVLPSPGIETSTTMAKTLATLAIVAGAWGVWRRFMPRHLGWAEAREHWGECVTTMALGVGLGFCSIWAIGDSGVEARLLVALVVVVLLELPRLLAAFIWWRRRIRWQRARQENVAAGG